MTEQTPLRHIVLVGLMGSGKTTVGSRLAERLGRPFRDSDAEITGSTGRTVRTLREEMGVDAMHALEAEQLLAALADPGPNVVAAAASVIEVPGCRVALAGPGVMVVWLRGSPGVLAERFGSGAHRPAYGADPAAFLADQAVLRDPLFRAVHPVAMDVDHLDPDAVVARIESLIRAAESAEPDAPPPMTEPPS
jgi:shikimate kinase